MKKLKINEFLNGTSNTSNKRSDIIMNNNIKIFNNQLKMELK